MIDNITVVMIVKNAETTIGDTLESLKGFAEVVVYENGSTDNTAAIAKSFSNVKLIEGTFIGFGETKNIAASFAHNNWIFSIDSDEVMSSELYNNLLTLNLDENNIYTITRVNYYQENIIKCCGWKSDILARLYNKNKTSFNNNRVHESIKINKFNLISIMGILKHHPYSSIDDFISKTQHYSTLFAQEHRGKKSSSPLKAILNSIYTFIKAYIFKRGFLNGYAGLLISFTHASSNFYKYMKLYEVNKK